MFSGRATGSSYGTNSNVLGNMATQSAYGFNQFNVNNVSRIYNTSGFSRGQYSTSNRSSNSSIASFQSGISQDLSTISGCDGMYTSEEAIQSVSTHKTILAEDAVLKEETIFTNENNIVQFQRTFECSVTTGNRFQAKPSEDIPVPRSGLKSQFTGKLKSISCCLMPYLTPCEHSR